MISIKVKGEVGAINYKKSIVKMEIKTPSLEMVNVVQVLQLVNNTFTLTMAKKNNGEVFKHKMKNVLFDKLSFCKDGEATLKVDVEPVQLLSLKDLDNFKEKVVFLIKCNGDNEGGEE